MHGIALKLWSLLRKIGMPSGAGSLLLSKDRCVSLAERIMVVMVSSIVSFFMAAVFMFVVCFSLFV